MSAYHEIASRFESHPLSAAQASQVETLRTQVKHAAAMVCAVTPSSREQSLALTHLEDALMWAVKSIALEAP